MFGDAFEALIFQEIAAYRDDFSKGSLYFSRSHKGYEVDFILDDWIAIEVKGKQRLSRDDFKRLRALKEEKRLKSIFSFA